jgi:hypothetical protein
MTISNLVIPKIMIIQRRLYAHGVANLLQTGLQFSFSGL